MSSFLKNLIKEIGDADTHILSEGQNSGEISGFIDTGSFMFNALLSGSLHGGLPDNRVTCLAGEEATGKTFFTLGVLSHFLTLKNENIAYYADTESALSKDTFLSHGCDPDRISIAEPATVEQFRNQSVQFLDAYLSQKERPNCMMVLDSLGMLATEKEVKDATDGNNVADMTRARTIRSTFRVLTLKLAKAKIPFILTNHVYDQMSLYSTKQVAGGGGVKYAASSIIMLSKKKDKDGSDIVGAIITAKTAKSRLSRENTEVELKLNYRTGLDRYYGLLDLAEEYSIIPAKAGRYEMPDGSKHFAKAIYGEPERFFTSEIMARLEGAANDKFRYGSTENAEEHEDL